MDIDIHTIIENKITEVNTVFLEGAASVGKKHTPFVFSDYTYLNESIEYFGVFALPYFLTYATFKDVEYRINNPYQKAIWHWKKDVNLSKAKDFLAIQTRLLHDTLKSSLSLLKSDNNLQALILLRSYIEYSSQFYACLLDYEFFQKYIESDKIDDSYKQLWFTNLKPEKVLSKIKAMHAEINKLFKEKKIVYPAHALYRQFLKPFDSTLREYLYTFLSGYAHGSYPAIMEEEDKLYASVFLCSAYLIESQIVIDEICTPVYAFTPPHDLFHKLVTAEIYIQSRKPQARLYIREGN